MLQHWCCFLLEKKEEEDNGEQMLFCFSYSPARWLQLLLLLDHPGVGRLASRDAQLCHLEHGGQALLFLEQVGVVDQPGGACLKGSNDARVEVSLVSWWRSGALHHTIALKCL